MKFCSEGYISLNVLLNCLFSRLGTRATTVATAWQCFKAKKLLLVAKCCHVSIYNVVTMWLRGFKFFSFLCRSLTRCRESEKLARAQLCIFSLFCFIYVLQYTKIQLCKYSRVTYTKHLWIQNTDNLEFLKRVLDFSTKVQPKIWDTQRCFGTIAQS